MNAKRLSCNLRSVCAKFFGFLVVLLLLPLGSGCSLSEKMNPTIAIHRDYPGKHSMSKSEAISILKAKLLACSMRLADIYNPGQTNAGNIRFSITGIDENSMEFTEYVAVQTSFGLEWERNVEYLVERGYIKELPPVRLPFADVAFIERKEHWIFLRDASGAFLAGSPFDSTSKTPGCATQHGYLWGNDPSGIDDLISALLTLCPNVM